MDTKRYGVSLLELFMILLKRKFIIIATVVGCVMAVEITIFMRGDTYQSSVIMIIEPSVNSSITTTNANGEINSLIGSDLTVEQKVQNNDVNYRITTGARLVSVCSAVMHSDMVLQPIIDELNLQCTTEDLADNIDVESLENSQMLQITVEATTSEKAEQICERLIIDSKTMILKLTDASSYEKIYSQQKSMNLTSVEKVKGAVIGAFLGMVLSVTGCIILYMLDDYIRTESAVVYCLDVKILGVIPREMEEKNGKRK